MSDDEPKYIETLMNNLQNKKAHLLRHAQMPRLRVSVTIQEMVAYCEAHREADPMLGDRKLHPNPFKSASRCTIL